MDIKNKVVDIKYLICTPKMQKGFFDYQNKYFQDKNDRNKLNNLRK